MPRPSLLISAGDDLFASFFSSRQRQRMGRRFLWQRHATKTLTADFQRSLATAEALVTTWDSPHFGDDLPDIAPQLAMIAHCGGEVKSRFSRISFQTFDHHQRARAHGSRHR